MKLFEVISTGNSYSAHNKALQFAPLRYAAVMRGVNHKNRINSASLTAINGADSVSDNSSKPAMIHSFLDNFIACT